MRAHQLAIFGVIGVLGSACTLAVPGYSETASQDPAPSSIPAGANTAPAGPADPAPATSSATASAPGESVPAAPTAPAALATDFCDEVSFGKNAWVDARRENVTLRYMPKTAAETDLETIAAVRNTLYVEIAAALGVAAPGNITIVLSPNRATAQENGYGKGVAYASLNRIEVLWLGHPDSYEVASPGHELTHVIASKVDGQDHLPFLDEGLAELLDGSGRDLHEAYVRDLRAGMDSAYLTRFSDGDVWGDHYGRAGSFVKFLVARGGMTKFLEIWKANAVTWSGGGYLTKSGVGVKTGADLETAIDKASRATYGVGFEALRLEWQTTLTPYLEAPAQTVTAEDAAAIGNVIANLDWADTHGNAAMLRSTMEGFYCDWQTDDSRAAIASSAVESRGNVQSQVISLFPISRRNYSQAVAHTIRRETRSTGEISYASKVWLEKFPMGWRVTYADRY